MYSLAELEMQYGNWTWQSCAWVCVCLDIRAFVECYRSWLNSLFYGGLLEVANPAPRFHIKGELTALIQSLCYFWISTYCVTICILAPSFAWHLRLLHTCGNNLFSYFYFGCSGQEKRQQQKKWQGRMACLKNCLSCTLLMCLGIVLAVLRRVNGTEWKTSHPREESMATKVERRGKEDLGNTNPLAIYLITALNVISMPYLLANSVYPDLWRL